VNNTYTVWAVALAVCLELGVFYLAWFGFIGMATTISCGFAVGAVMVTALMLSDASFDDLGEPSRDPDDH
jgi:hypothetical protein